MKQAMVLATAILVALALALPASAKDVSGSDTSGGVTEYLGMSYSTTSKGGYSCYDIDFAQGYFTRSSSAWDVVDADYWVGGWAVIDCDTSSLKNYGKSGSYDPYFEGSKTRSRYFYPNMPYVRLGSESKLGSSLDGNVTKYGKSTAYVTCVNLFIAGGPHC